MDKIELFLSANDMPFEKNVDLSHRTWIHRGGIATYYITPNSSFQLESVCKFLYGNGIDFDIYGSTSNLYIKNTYNPFIVVSTRKCNSYAIEADGIICECGTNVMKLAKECVMLGIGGYEYLTALPGTIGGAVVNNSSCKSNSISANLLSAEILLDNGTLEHWTNDDFDFSFRRSILKDKRINGVLLRVRLQKRMSDPDLLKQNSEKYMQERVLILEGPAQNLGCAINLPYKNGPMPCRYKIPYCIFSAFIKVFVRERERKLELAKNFLLAISGHRELSTYISNKLYQTFIWRDEQADKYFADYIRFMNDVFNTDSLEIEVKE